MDARIRRRIVARLGLMWLLSLVSWRGAAGAVESAGARIVDLDARDASAGTAVWVNAAPANSVGDFDRVGTPTLTTVGGQWAIQFDGAGGLYRSQGVTAATLEGASDRSIEVWVHNPSVDSPEETMIGWGHRGTNSRDLGFNYGSSGVFGAATHYGAADMGWNGFIPTAGQWHHLVYTYDGTNVRIYDNTVQRNAATRTLNTFGGDHINIGAQNAANGGILFINEFNGSQIMLSGAIAIVRVHDGALTPAQIAINFNEDKARFGATVPPAPVDMLADGYIDLDTPDFNLRLVRSSQTIAALNPKGAGTFDFTPADRLSNRKSDGYNHLGDLTMRLREGTSGAWSSYSTAAERFPVDALTTGGQVLAAADLSPTLPAGCPLDVERYWELDGSGRLMLRFVLTNQTAGPVQVGALGMPMVFNNYISGRTLTQAHTICSFPEPYIGMEAGYVQVTRLNGAGPALLVVPEENASFEAYNALLDDLTARSQGFEGFHEWTVHSQAWAENEWAATEPWNAPTIGTIDAGTSRSYAIKFLLSTEIRDIDPTLEAAGRPVTVGVPGYILPQGLNGRLFLKHAAAVESMSVDPPGAIAIDDDGPTSGGWRAYTLHAQSWGRARLTVTYADGLEQSISYYLIKPMAQAVADLGNFLFTNQWYSDTADYFGRAPSIITYDRELDEPVLQDNRVWVAGLQDEAGAGSWVAASMKLFGQPETSELTKFQQFVDGVLWGRIQYSADQGGDRAMYTVRRSLFYYAPSDLPPGYYTIGSGWTRTDSENIWRAYNYPHVAVANWAMYRLARNNPGLVTNHTWDWYLDHAWRAGWAMRGTGVSYDEHGLMEGSVFLEILKDMIREGMTTEVAEYEGRMEPRADAWSTQAYPFGSEFAWDSTGQEEVYVWSKYYGYEAKARDTLNAILGYMATVPHWGYNGNARRYWDFQYGGKIRRIERQIHHYGSGLNAIPVLQDYREHPDDFYLLRVGYGGAMGALSNIDQEGFASVAFHSRPDTMKWDALSGDYGPNFYGHAMNIATYLLNHPEFGWIAFGGNVTTNGRWTTVQPLDSYRQRVYVEPFGLWLTCDAGTIERVEVDLADHFVRVGLAPAGTFTPDARLRVEQPATLGGVGTFQPFQTPASERGAYVVPLNAGTTWITLSDLPPPAAEIRLGTTNVPNGAGPIDLGTVARGGTAISATFTVRNGGGSTLLTADLATTGGYLIVEGLDAAIPPGGEDAFTVVLPATTAGLFEGQVTFTANDPQASAYSFTLSAGIMAVNAVEIWVDFAYSGPQLGLAAYPYANRSSERHPFITRERGTKP